MKELAEILGISSASAYDQVNQLIRKGYLKREPRKARGIVIVRELRDYSISQKYCIKRHRLTEFHFVS